MLLLCGSEKLVEVDGEVHGFFESLSHAEHFADELEILLQLFAPLRQRQVVIPVGVLRISFSSDLPNHLAELPSAVPLHSLQVLRHGLGADTNSINSTLKYISIEKALFKNDDDHGLLKSRRTFMKVRS